MYRKASAMETSFESVSSSCSTDRMDFSVSDGSDSDSDSDMNSNSDINSDSSSNFDSDDSSSDFDSDNDSNSDSDFSRADSSSGLRKDLATLVAKSRARTENVSSLLKILRKHGSTDTPMCYSTLMGTPKTKIIQRDVGPGKYFHYGIANNLLKLESILKDNIFESLDIIQIDIGIDGGSPFNSSKLSLWPIVGAFAGIIHISPFLIGCYAGPGDFKASDTDVYLQDFCDELEILFTEGILMKCGHKNIVIRLFSLDSPARAKICNIMGHSSHDGCPLCAWTKLVYAGKVVYPNKIGPHLRSDETFYLRTFLDHHHEEMKYRFSRLEQLGFKMVSQFPLDPMHCIDLGVVLRCLENLVSISQDEIVLEISKRITEFKDFRPDEFARDCRSLKNLSKFKATELRQFLLYGSPVFLSGLVSDIILNHWLLLHSAIRLLSNSDLTPNSVDVAEKLLEKFVGDYPKIYGKYSVTYIIHVLLHLTFFVRLYGSLDSFSAYKFENFMQRLKKWVGKGNSPLQQIYNRMEEQFNHNPESLTIKKFNKWKIKCNGKDSYVAIIDNGVIVPTKVIRIERLNRIKYIYVAKCLNVRPLYLSPIDSSNIGEIMYSGISTVLEKYKVSDVKFKYCRIPHGESFALSAILHSTFKRFDH